MSKEIPTIRVVKREYTEQPFVVKLYLLPPYEKGYDRLFGFKDLKAPELTEIFNFFYNGIFNFFYNDIEGATEVYLLEKKFTKDRL